MNWDAVAAIAELLGAISVVSTLVYLSIQTRQARSVSERSAYYAELQANVSTVDMYSRWRTYLQNAILLEVIAKANSGHDIAAEEQIMLSAAFERVWQPVKPPRR
jgi:hypothetical protein